MTARIMERMGMRIAMGIYIFVINGHAIDIIIKKEERNVIL